MNMMAAENAVDLTRFSASNGQGSWRIEPAKQAAMHNPQEIVLGRRWTVAVLEFDW